MARIFKLDGGQTAVLAGRNLLRHRRRALLAILTVCGGVVTFLLAGGFINWVLESMRDAAIYSQLGHIQVTRPGYFSEGVADPYRFLLPEDAGEVARADPEKRIRTIAPRLDFSGLLSKGDATISFVGEGIDPLKEEPIAIAISVTEGRELTESGPESMIIGKGLADNLGARPGDQVVLLVTTADGGLNAVELEVVGLFVSTVKAYDDSAIRVPIDVARQLMRVEGATSWVVLLENTGDTPRMVEQLGAALPESGFEIVPWWDLADFYNKTVELFSRQVGVVRILIGLIVILSISNTLTMAVIERISEIGTSMALGVRRSGIRRLFILEGSLLGLVGGAVGVAIGVLLGAVISYFGIPMPPAPGMSEGYIGQISISLALAFDAFLLAFVTTLLASIFPAWKASRMNIVDALRHQR